MPRGPRLDAAGTIHHVMMRGLDRRRIFVDDADRRDLVSRLGRVLPECGASCLAWALLPNHVHLVLRTERVHLSRVLARVNTGYALRFNRRHGRVGFLFQNRFKSRAAADDADLLGIVRYVDLNPLKHGVVPDLVALARYEWCSHAAIVGRRAPAPFESAREIERLLGIEPGDELARRRRWIVFCRQATQDRVDPVEREERGRRGDAPGAAVPATPPAAEAPRPAAGVRARHDPDALEALVRAICAELGVREEALRSRAPTRAVSLARARIARRAVLGLGLPPVALAERFGVSREAIRRAVERGRAAEAAPAGPPSG